MFHRPCRNMETNLILSVPQGAQRLSWGDIMNNFIHHELFLRIIQLCVINQPRVCACHMGHLVVEWVSEILLNVSKAITTSRVRNNPYVFEPWIFNIVFPYEARVVRHILLEGNLLTFIILFFVGIHNEYSKLWLMVDSPVYLREHRANFKISRYTCWSSPDTGAHRAWSLN